MNLVFRAGKEIALETWYLLTLLSGVPDDRVNINPESDFHALNLIFVTITASIAFLIFMTWIIALIML